MAFRVLLILPEPILADVDSNLPLMPARVTCYTYKTNIPSAKKSITSPRLKESNGRPKHATRSNMSKFGSSFLQECKNKDNNGEDWQPESAEKLFLCFRFFK